MSENQKIKYLDKEKVLQVLDKVLENEPEIRASIKSSKSSFSIYFRLHLGKHFISRRISDHSPNNYIKTLIVGPTTKYKHVENFISGAVKDLKKIYRSALLKDLEEQMKNGKDTYISSVTDETIENNKSKTQ